MRNHQAAHGILLAAGRGSRMAGETDNRPKCLVGLAGKPLVDWQREALTLAGVNELALVSGYRYDRLQNKAKTRFHNPRWESTNMVGSLLCADAWLQAYPCIISYSDIVYHPAVVRTLLNTPGDVVLSYDTQWLDLWSLRFEDVLSDAETFRRDSTTGHLLEIGQSPRTTEEIEGQFMGLLKITPSGWQTLRKHLDRLPPETVDKMDTTGLLNHLLQAGETIQTAAISGQWCEVDSRQDLMRYQKALASATPWSHDWRPEPGNPLVSSELTDVFPFSSHNSPRAYRQAP